MAVLVTRPHPDDETTAAGLRARGFDVLRAPMLRFEPVAVHEDMNVRYSAVIVTSANALRGIEPHLKGHRMLELPLFAVGDHTAAAARRAGFTHVVSANGDAANLRDLVLASLRAKELKKASTLLYLAGAEIARDLASELEESGFRVVTQTTYRMIAVKGLPSEARDAFAANQVEAVLHYSQRSARAFLDAARAAGVEISALAIPQCCISATVASVVPRRRSHPGRGCGDNPDENALFEALERALRP